MSLIVIAVVDKIHIGETLVKADVVDENFLELLEGKNTELGLHDKLLVDVNLVCQHGLS
jgi:hypothetical protein